MTEAPRRVVTGHTSDGRAVMVQDGRAPFHRFVSHGVHFYELWRTTGCRAVLTAVEEDPVSQLTITPHDAGTVVRINEFLPGHLTHDGRQSPMHRTETVDYGIVLSGEIWLLLDEEEIRLQTGDVVVQRGTVHAWANRSAEPARMLFVLVAAEYEQVLRELVGPPPPLVLPEEGSRKC